MKKNKHIESSNIEELYSSTFDMYGKRHLKKVEHEDQATHVLMPIQQRNGLLKIMSMWSAKACQNYGSTEVDENGYRVESAEYRIYQRGNAASKEVKAWLITMATKYAYSYDEDGNGEKKLEDVTGVILADLRACYGFVDLPCFNIERLTDGEKKGSRYQVTAMDLLKPDTFLNPDNPRPEAKVFKDWYQKLPKRVGFEVKRVWPRGGKGQWMVSYWAVDIKTDALQK